MTGTRIMLALQKKLSGKRNYAKIKRLQKGIEVALANAEEKAAAAEDELDKLTQNFNVDTDVQFFIRNISMAMYDKDEAVSTIEQLNRINDYLFEELDLSDAPTDAEDQK